MPLHKIADFDPNYKETFGGEDVVGLNLYTEGEREIGTVVDVLVDDEGHFRYLVINTGVDTAGKQILLPIGLSRIEYSTQRVYVDGLSKEQVERLPEYSDRYTVDYDYEERVRDVYRPQISALESIPTAAGTAAYDRNSYNYQQDASLYDLNEQNHQTFRLYQERLIASKNRIKTGEVAIGKHIETETERVSVPLEKERVVIERVASTDTATAVSPSETAFQEGELARIELYEETPEIHKEAFVREEVRVKKVVDRETFNAEETVRREELDIDTQGRSAIDETQPSINERI
ncbi:MAG TPA: photosystem reaction center subunit H [Cyanobacteria bacterium UBA11049]|nr:photosystem reaction center subunit H [Cyanobacteria bacterium UBA11049]